MELDSVRVPRQPSPSLFVEAVARSIVDDEENLSGRVLLDEAEQELMERSPVEHLGKLIREARILQFNGTKDMRRFAEPVCIDTRLSTNARPCRMQCAVEPEARLVLEDHEATARGRFFLIAGNRLRIQSA